MEKFNQRRIRRTYYHSKCDQIEMNDQKNSTALRVRGQSSRTPFSLIVLTFCEFQWLKIAYSSVDNLCNYPLMPSFYNIFIKNFIKNLTKSYFIIYLISLYFIHIFLYYILLCSFILLIFLFHKISRNSNYLQTA